MKTPLAFFLGCILISQSSCLQNRLEKQISINTADLIHQSSQVASNLNSPPKFQLIQWNSALGHIKKKNQSYLSSLESTKNSRERLNQQWWGILPRVATFANLSSGITNLTDLNSDDISGSVIANLNIPSPFQFYAQRYVFKLQELSSTLQVEQTWRQLNVSLYQLYLNQISLEEQIKEQTLLAKSLDLIPIQDITPTKKNIRATAESIFNQQQQLRLRINQLLGTPGANWKLSSPPNIRFSEQIQNFRLGKDGFGLLGLKLQAVQLELAQLQLNRAKWSRVPQFNFSASNPPLFSTTGNQFDSDDIRLFAGANKSFSTRDPLGKENIRNTEQRLVNTKAQLRANAEQEIIQLNAIQKRHDKLKKQLKKQLIAAKDQNSSSTASLEKQTPEQLLADIRAAKTSEKTIANLKRQITQIELKIWQWDERQW